jgi:CRP/FNR family transcriptional activator FtrB
LAEYGELMAGGGGEVKENEIDATRQLSLFEGMDEDNFNALIQGSYLQNFPPGLQLITEGDPADFLHIVVEGCIELFATANSRETTLAMVHPVRTFILAAVLKDNVYLMSARTAVKSRILMVPSARVREAMEQDDKFARGMVHELADYYRATVRSLKNQKLRTGVEKLANFLITQHELQGSSGVCKLPHDKRTLASLLGMTPENLSRAFGALAPYGIEVNGSTINLENLDDLVKLAKPTKLIDG